MVKDDFQSAYEVLDRLIYSKDYPKNKQLMNLDLDFVRNLLKQCEVELF